MVDPTLVGWGFITAGIILLLIETTMPGFFIGIPGTVLLVIGTLAFVAPEIALDPFWAPIITIVVGVPATLGTIMFYKRLAPAKRPPTTLSADSLIGKHGRVTRVIDSESRKGKVRVERSEWQALSESGSIPVGAHVSVVGVDGVTLIVRVHDESAPASQSSASS